MALMGLGMLSAKADEGLRLLRDIIKLLKDIRAILQQNQAQ